MLETTSGAGMEGLQPVAVLPRRAQRPRGRAVLDWLREQVTTTPGRLAAISIAVLASAVLVGVIATVAEQSRSQAANAARAQTEPLLVEAGNLYSALTDANATVTSTLLRGGGESSATRGRYLRDLTQATDALTALTRQTGNSPGERAALGVIAAQLPLYSGLVESARANDLQGFPIGAAYLRQASGVLMDKVLPAAERVYEADARLLGNDYSKGTATSSLTVFLVVVVVALVLLVAAQLYVARTSRRILNVPMVAASAVLAGASIWGVVGLISEQSALASARRSGSDSVEVLSATRVLLARAQSDVSLTLVNRRSDEADPLDLKAVMQALVGGGLIRELSVLAQRTGTTAAANRFDNEFAAYRGELGQLSTLENSGQITTAINDAPASRNTSEQMSTNLGGQIAAAQGRFVRQAANATSALSGLGLALPLMTALAAAMALIGLRQRINEYR